nr:kinesin-like protein KIF23 [Cherax quadricarinatus]
MSALSLKRPRVRQPRLTSKPQNLEPKNGKDPVEVTCRIKPPDNVDEDHCICAFDLHTVKLIPPATSFAFRNGCGKEQYYKFQHVFNPEATQKQVFDQVAKPLVADLLQGKNGLLFAYGVTGSGKTYTMEGTPDNSGIIQRTLDAIFNTIQDYQAQRCVFMPDHMNGFDIQTEAEAAQERKAFQAQSNVCKTPRTPRQRTVDTPVLDIPMRIPDGSKIDDLNEDNVYAVFVTHIEIYQNYIYDLLDEASGNGQSHRGFQAKVLSEGFKSTICMFMDCIEVEVMVKGQKRRKVATTNLNLESSRSHSIFSIRVVQAPLDVHGEEVLQEKAALSISQLSLVDLAGSERNSRTRAKGGRVKEAGNINNSLMTLRSCIEVLRENQTGEGHRMVPYRDSKLTHYLKNYFGGEGRIKMIVCINPNAEDYDENQTVMKFAELISEVQIDRATPVAQTELWLPPGRRQANKFFKSIRKKLEEEGENVMNMEMDTSIIYRLAPAWPSLNYTQEDWEGFFDMLKTYMRKRIHCREKAQASLPDKIAHVRTRLLDLEKEIVYLQQENTSLTALYNNVLAKNHSLEDRLFNEEITIENLKKDLVKYNKLEEELKAVLEERDLAKNHEERQKQQMKDGLKRKLRDESEKLRREMFEIGPAVCDQRYRSSLVDQHDAWLNHCPKQMVPMGTALQPILNTQKVVTNVKKAHLEKNTITNYCLTTQDQDSQGEMETRVYKGDVLPTAGGGSQVVLKDVEVHKQREIQNVGINKSLPKETPRIPTESIQERCSTGIQFLARPGYHSP